MQGHMISMPFTPQVIHCRYVGDITSDVSLSWGLSERFLPRGCPHLSQPVVFEHPSALSTSKLSVQLGGEIVWKQDPTFL